MRSEASRNHLQKLLRLCIAGTTTKGPVPGLAAETFRATPVRQLPIGLRLLWPAFSRHPLAGPAEGWGKRCPQVGIAEGADVLPFLSA